MTWLRGLRLGKFHIPLNFASIHYIYFISISLFCPVIFWASSDPKLSVTYVDSLFLVISGITETGLNTINLSTLTTWQQALLCLLMLFGGSVWVSIGLIIARERSLRRVLKLDHTVQRQDKLTQQQTNDNLSSIIGQGMQNSTANDLEITDANYERVWSRRRSVNRVTAGLAVAIQHTTPLSKTCYGAETVIRSEELEVDPLKLLSGKNIGRNGCFINLTLEEKRNVNIIEHRALKLLATIVPLYFTLWQLLGCAGLGAWIAHHQPEPALANGINPWWLGIFNGVSAFNNSGMSLLDANMIPYQGAYYVLVTMGLLILAGNTAYPIFLRFILWAILKALDALPRRPLIVRWRLTVKYVLRYPRRVYTNLFPIQHTWWLVFMLVVLNGIDWAAFELLPSPVVSAIPRGPRLVDGLFQAIAVRTGGFYVVPIANIHIGLQVLYVIMMYISAFPVIITMRNSNVYEEWPLDIFAMDTKKDKENLHMYNSGLRSGNAKRLFISQQIRGQLAHDIWWLALATFIVTVIEAPHFTEDPVSYSVFNIIFEVVSAYGGIGISVGLPNQNFSFSGGWSATSKLVLCLVMLRGRHRGLPATMDYAVRLPEHLTEEYGVKNREEQGRHGASSNLC